MNRLLRTLRFRHILVDKASSPLPNTIAILPINESERSSAE